MSGSAVSAGRLGSVPDSYPVGSFNDLGRIPNVAVIRPIVVWLYRGAGAVPGGLAAVKMGDTGFEPVTSCVSSMRSSQLS